MATRSFSWTHFGRNWLFDSWWRGVGHKFFMTLKRGVNNWNISRGRIFVRKIKNCLRFNQILYAPLGIIVLLIDKRSTFSNKNNNFENLLKEIFHRCRDDTWREIYSFKNMIRTKVIDR